MENFLKGKTKQNKYNNSFSLAELMIVIAIVMVLGGIAIPSYWGARQRALRREAEGLLKLMQAAQKIRYMETGSYVVCNTTADCNTRLNLDLPRVGAWNYSAGQNGCVQASGSIASLCLRINSEIVEDCTCN